MRRRVVQVGVQVIRVVPTGTQSAESSQRRGCSDRKAPACPGWQGRAGDRAQDIIIHDVLSCYRSPNRRHRTHGVEHAGETCRERGMWPARRPHPLPGKGACRGKGDVAAAPSAKRKGSSRRAVCTDGPAGAVGRSGPAGAAEFSEARAHAGSTRMASQTTVSGNRRHRRRLSAVSEARARAGSTRIYMASPVGRPGGSSREARAMMLLFILPGSGPAVPTGPSARRAGGGSRAV